MTIDTIIGDTSGFFREQRCRLQHRGIDIAGCPLSHLAVRTETYVEYVRARDDIEQLCSANIENVWNGRPISKMLLAEAIDLGDGFTVQLLELIPPPHRSVYKMGLEHTGIVIGQSVDEFARKNRSVLTGQQFQSERCEPYFITFDDHTNVKFYRYSLMDVVASEGQRFDGFYHADDWECASNAGC